MTKTQLITIFTLFLIAIACKDFNSVECELEESRRLGTGNLLWHWPNRTLYKDRLGPPPNTSEINTHFLDSA